MAGGGEHAMEGLGTATSREEATEDWSKDKHQGRGDGQTMRARGG